MTTCWIPIWCFSLPAFCKGIDFSLPSGHKSRALHSLTPAQAEQIVAGLSSLALAWTIERHESCDGYLSLLVSHADHDTTIIVDRDHVGIHVSLLLGDQMHTSHYRYATTGDTVGAIKAIAAAPAVEPQRHTG